MIKQKTGHPKPIPEKNYSLAALENNVADFYSTPEESKYCLCDICLQNYEIKEKGKQFLRQSSSMFKIDSLKMKKFFQLLASVDHKIYFRLNMPDICFFQAGEGKLLVKTKLTAVITIPISPELRKQIPNFFVDAKKINTVQPVNFSENQNPHIKYLDSIIPSVKHGLSNDNPANLPKNYTFHNDQRQSQDNEIYKLHQNAARDVAIVKYKEKGLELVNQKQLRQLLKSATKTQTIELIQTYIRPHQKEAEFVSSEYLHYRKPQNVLMFNRSLIQLKTQIGLLSKFSKEYIATEVLEQYEAMLRDAPEEYCLYETYKMVHYIEINRDIKIKHLNTVWFKDEYGEITFFGVLQFDFEQNEKINAEINSFVEIKDLARKELTDLEKELLGTWERMKKKKIKETRPDSNLNQDELKQVEIIKLESQIRSHQSNSKRKGSVRMP